LNVNRRKRQPSSGTVGEPTGQVLAKLARGWQGTARVWLPCRLILPYVEIDIARGKPKGDVFGRESLGRSGRLPEEETVVGRRRGGWGAVSQRGRVVAQEE